MIVSDEDPPITAVAYIVIHQTQNIAVDDARWLTLSLHPKNSVNVDLALLFFAVADKNHEIGSEQAYNSSLRDFWRSKMLDLNNRFDPGDCLLAIRLVQRRGRQTGTDVQR